MEDGSEHDHDSHIMVWQVRDQQQNCNFVRDDPNADIVDKKDESSESPPQLSNNTLNVKVDLESRYSRSSTSSVDLGPAPGSGLVTADASEVSDNEGGGNGSEAGSRIDRTISMGLEMTESMTASSLMQFNRDVESMLEHDEPKEDFTQHIDN